MEDRVKLSFRTVDQEYETFVFSIQELKARVLDELVIFIDDQTGLKYTDPGEILWNLRKELRPLLS